MHLRTPRPTPKTPPPSGHVDRAFYATWNTTSPAGFPASLRAAEAWAHVRHPQLAQVAFADLPAVLRVDEIGDARKQALAALCRERAVARVRQQRVDVLRGRVRDLPLVAAENRGPEAPRAVHVVSVPRDVCRALQTQAGRCRGVPAFVAGLGR